MKLAMFVALCAISCGGGTFESLGNDEDDAGDEAEDTGIIDSSAREFHLVFTEMPGGYGRLEGAADLQSAITVEGWFKGQPGSRIGLGRRCEASGWRIAFAQDEVGATVYGGFNHYPNVDNADRWRHLAWTFDGITSSLFVDGLFVGRLDEAGPFVPCDAPLIVGAWVDQSGEISSFQSGSVDEIRISNAVRYTENFSPAPREFDVDSSTIALWHFNEGRGQEIVNEIEAAPDHLVGDFQWVEGSGFE